MNRVPVTPDATGAYDASGVTPGMSIEMTVRDLYSYAELPFGPGGTIRATVHLPGGSADLPLRITPTTRHNDRRQIYPDLVAANALYWGNDFYERPVTLTWTP